MNKRNLRWITASTLVAEGFLMAFSLAPRSLAAEGDSEQVSNMLSETRSLAFQLRNDTAAMESFRRMNLDPMSHKVAINEIRDQINALGRQVNKLKALEAEAAPWQRTAIQRIDPYLEELGGYTSAIIERLNGDRTHTIVDYNDYLQANADYASDLYATLTDFAAFGNARGKVEDLGTKLEIPQR
jgi:hypothetical protein